MGWLLREGAAATEKGAVAAGNAMMSLGLLHHVVPPPPAPPLPGSVSALLRQSCPPSLLPVRCWVHCTGTEHLHRTTRFIPHDAARVQASQAWQQSCSVSSSMLALHMKWRYNTSLVPQTKVALKPLTDACRSHQSGAWFPQTASRAALPQAPPADV